MVKRKIVWDEQAKQQLWEYCDYIRKSSPKGAKKVRQAIIETVRMLPKHPEMFTKDRFIGHKDNYRSFTKWSYRVTYLVTDLQIIIVKIVHTSQNQNAPQTEEE